jgi:hypothetical protein
LENFVRKTFLTALRYACAIVLLISASQSRAQLASVSNRAPAAGGVEAQPYSSSALLSEPDPAWTAADPAELSAERHEGPFVPPGMVQHYGMLSRLSVGSSISPFGIGAQGAVILNEYVDARVDSGWFFYNTGRVEIGGVNAVGDFHLASLGAKVDWYPTRGFWRISPGMLFYNGNRVSATLDLTGGTNISVNGKDYWSATENPATGATPLTGDVNLALRSHTPAFTIAGGFGKFVPHSHRHWSFPTEFGVAFTGPPTLNVKLSGWVCTDKAQTRCSDVGDPNNPVGLQFQHNLDSALAKWQHDLDYVHVYPIFSTSFMYSFDLPGGR